MSVAVAAGGALVASAGVEGTWADAAPLIGQSAVYLTTGMIIGVAFGMVVLGSSPAIVALFALPIAWTVVASLSFFAASPRGWTRALPSTRCPPRSSTPPSGRTPAPRSHSGCCSPW